MRLLMLLGWALAFLGTAGSDVIFGEVDKKIVLTPSDFSGKISSILWKYGENLAVLWDGTELEYYRQFKGRSNLNLENGEFTITKLSLTDTNSYTPEVNNVLLSKIELKVLRPVPTPRIIQENYTFSCTGDTRDAEPVTYSWTLDNQMLPISLKEIHKGDYTCPATFTCTMRNPVSEMRSAEYRPCVEPVTIVIISFVVIIALLGAVAASHRIKTKQWFFRKGRRFWTAEFWKDTTKQPVNGNEGADESVRMAKE